MARVRRPNLIGQVLRLIYRPCTPNGAEFWIETAVPASLALFYSLVKPDPKFVLHTLSGKSWLKWLKGDVEAVHRVEPSFVSGGTVFVVRVAEIVDPVTWYVWLADVAEEGLVNWTTMVWKLEGCDNSGMPDQYCGVQPIGVVPSNADWFPCAAFYRIGPGCNGYFCDYGAGPAGGGFFAGFAMSVLPYFGPPFLPQFALLGPGQTKPLVQSQTDGNLLAANFTFTPAVGNDWPPNVFGRGGDGLGNSYMSYGAGELSLGWGVNLINPSPWRR